MIQYGRLAIDPTRNPAVLDTGTWSPDGASKILSEVPETFWSTLYAAAEKGRSLPTGETVRTFPGSVARAHGQTWLLLQLTDGQRVFGTQETTEGTAGKLLGQPLLRTASEASARFQFFPAHDSVIDRFCRLINPSKGPRALASTPRLGIGCRMSTSIWPGVWRGMTQGGFAANAIQNSLRELSLLQELKDGKPPRTNHQFGFGAVQEGHTGSSFEGLWTEGVLSAIQSTGALRYGADADHIMVKRTPDGLERAKRIVEAGRYYSFFTLDVSDILDYEALDNTDSTLLEKTIADPLERRLAVLYHQNGLRVGGFDYRPDETRLAALFGKYSRGLDAATALEEHIESLKKGVPFDLELSIDENPPTWQTCDCLTGADELVFLLLEAQRRGLGLSHIAPNFGIEKGTDYRCPDGLAGLESRSAQLYRIAEEFGIMLDCHSGDDLGRETRRAMGRASRGRIHFKISPSLQVTFGEVVHELAPDLFQFWWDDALAHAREQAAAGSDFAAGYLKAFESGDQQPHPHNDIFHHFNFATLGKRDEQNVFYSRERFYDLSSEVLQAYTERVAAQLLEAAEDVFQSG